MSQYFNITPRSGSGDGEITVIPVSNNFTNSDKVATITVSNGRATPKTVRVIQYNAPRVVQFGGSTTVQATGGTLMYNIYTHYDFVFRSVPDYVTIRDSKGNVYSEGEAIAAGRAYDTTFFIDLAPNPSQNSRSVGTTFNIGHFIDGVVQRYVYYISYTQLGQPTMNYVIPSTSFVSVDYPNGSETTFTISSNTQTWVTNSNTEQFSVVQNDSAITVTANEYNSSSFNNEATITISGAATPAPVSVSVVQYNLPKISQFGGGNTVSSAGGTLFYSVSTHYDFVFRSVPSWITIYDGRGNYYSEGQVIPASVAADNTFYFEVARNDTGSSRSVGSTFNMGHYIDGVLQNRVSYISIMQLS